MIVVLVFAVAVVVVTLAVLVGLGTRRVDELVRRASEELAAERGEL